MISKFLIAPMWEDHDSGLGLSSQARLDYFIKALIPSMVAHSCNPIPWKAKADNQVFESSSEKLYLIMNE